MYSILTAKAGLGPGRAGPLSLHGALARSERRDLFGNAAQISRDITFLPSLTWLPFASHRNTRNATQRRLANMTKLRAHARFGGKASKNEREGGRDEGGLGLVHPQRANGHRTRREAAAAPRHRSRGKFGLWLLPKPRACAAFIYTCTIRVKASTAFHG